MFPQRSQYFSSILRNCDDLEITSIVPAPLIKKTCRPQKVKIAGVEHRARDHTAASDRARIVCDDLSDFNCFKAAPPPMDFAAGKSFYFAADQRSSQPAIVLTREVAFFVTRLEDCAVLNDDTETAGKLDFPEKM